MKFLFKIACLFLLINSFQLSAQNKGIVLDKVIAVVGKQTVLLSELESQYAEITAQGMGSGQELKCQILEQLLYSKLLINQAQKDSIEITEAEVNDYLDGRIRFFIERIGSVEKLEAFYGKSIQEIKEEFREATAKQMLADRMRNSITQDVKVTPTEINRFYRSLPKDSIPQIKEQYVFTQIVKDPPVSEQQKEAIKEKLRGYRQRILDGDKFSTLAVLYSEDPGSARKGGELGFKDRKGFVPEFSAVAFSLKEPGDISRIVETEFGFHIIQLIEKRGEMINTRHILLQPKISTENLIKAKGVLDSVRTLIVDNKMTFNEAALKFSDDEASKQNGGLMINPMLGQTVYEKDQIPADIAYTIRGLKEGDISKPFLSKNQKGQKVYKFIKIKKIIPEHQANIKDDYQFINDLCTADKQNKLIEEWVAKTQKETYIKIEDEYKNCKFNYSGWIK